MKSYGWNDTARRLGQNAARIAAMLLLVLTFGPRSTAADSPDEQAAATEPALVEHWTVVLYQDKTTLGPNWASDFEKHINDKEKLDKELGLSDSHVDPASDTTIYAELLNDLGLLSLPLPYQWTFDVQAPPFTKITFPTVVMPDKRGFSVASDEMDVHANSGGSVDIGRESVSQSWRVQVDQAPVVARDNDGDFPAVITLANGKSMNPTVNQTVRVTARAGDGLKSMIRVYRLTLTYPSIDKTTQLLQFFQVSGTDVIASKEKGTIVFVPASAKLGTSGKIVMMQARLPVDGPDEYYFVPTESKEPDAALRGISRGFRKVTGREEDAPTGNGKDKLFLVQLGRGEENSNVLAIGGERGHYQAWLFIYDDDTEQWTPKNVTEDLGQKWIGQALEKANEIAPNAGPIR